MSGATMLSAGTAGGRLRDPDGKSTGSLQPALRCALSDDLHGRTTQTIAGRQAATVAGAPGPSRHLRL